MSPAYVEYGGGLASDDAGAIRDVDKHQELLTAKRSVVDDCREHRRSGTLCEPYVDSFGDVVPREYVRTRRADAICVEREFYCGALKVYGAADDITTSEKSTSR